MTSTDRKKREVMAEQSSVPPFVDRGDQTPLLRADGVMLTGHTKEDVPGHLAGEDEETARRFGWWPQQSTEATVRAAHQQWAAEWRSAGDTSTFAIRETVTGHLVGGCQLRLQTDGSGQISWWTHATERRKGYATRAVKLLVEYAESSGIDRLEAHVAEDNHASRKVAESAGFTYLNTFTEDDGTLKMRYERRTRS